MTQPALPADSPEASGRLLFLLALVAGLVLRLVRLGSADLSGPEEGLWAVGARNIAEAGFPQLLAVSATPLGGPSGTPVFFPLLLSVGIKIFGAVEWAIRLPSAFSGLVLAFILERVVRRGYGQPAGHLAGAFAALAPTLVVASRTATVEPSLTALGLGGIIFGLRAFEEDSPGEAPLSGFLFGLGFLAKGHVVGLFLLPLLLALAARPGLFTLGRTKRTLALLLGTFAATAVLHLAAVALLAPEGLGLQLASAFGSVPSAVRLLSSGLLFSAELRSIVRTLFFLLPLAGLGLAFLARPVEEDAIVSGATGGERRLSHGVLWATYAVEMTVLVAIAGKVQLSSVPVLPALSALAGFGAAALLTRPRSDRRVGFETSVAILSSLLVVAVALVLMQSADDPLFGAHRSFARDTAPLLAILACGGAAAFFVARRGPLRLARRAAFVFLAVLLVVEASIASRWVERQIVLQRTGLVAVAQHVAPDLASLAPQTTAFRSPQPETLAFHLFRSGESWAGVTAVEQVAAEAAAGDVRCWVFRPASPVGPSAPPEAVQEWLAAHAHEVTGEVDARAGRKTGLRVFLGPVPPPS